MRILSIIITNLFFIFSFTTLANAQNNDNVIVVFDGSGSMWGQIDGTSKIEIARNAMQEMVDAWNDRTGIGLIAYGHRKKGDCADIETLLPAGQINKTAFMAAINAIQPKGKTPISAAVRKAAESLKYTEQKATVILISDGLETCNADPCVLASELESTGVDFTTHVIGFDINKADSAKLACLATNTGGKFISASNAAELNNAITETVQTVQTVQKAAPEPAPVPKGPQGIKAIPVICETCTDVLEKDVFWYLYEAQQDANGNRREIGRNGSATALFETAEGRYFVYGTYGQAAAGVEVEVKPGTLTEVKVNFNAGNLRVSGAATAGTSPLDKDMFYWVYDAKKDMEGNRREIARSGAASQLFHLPAGEFYVVAQHGNAFASAELTVQPNELTDYVFDMNVGYLKVNAIPTNGSAVLNDNMFYWVYEDKKDLEGNRKEVTRSGAASQLFKLPAGKYYIVAQHGKAYTSASVEISANALSEYTFDMNVGYFRVNAIMAEGMPPIEDNMFYWVYDAKKDLEGNRKEVARSGAASQLFRLAAGKYYVVAQHGKALSEKEITVEAGALSEETLVENSTIIRVTPTVANGGVLANDVFWWVYDAKKDLEGNHREIARSGAVEQTFILPAGDYIFAVRNAGQIHNTDVTLEPGEQKKMTVEIQPN
ncbi:MAG: VWA domain-containing protein [Amylibacter sp.]